MGDIQLFFRRLTKDYEHSYRRPHHFRRWPVAQLKYWARLLVICIKAPHFERAATHLTRGVLRGRLAFIPLLRAECFPVRPHSGGSCRTRVYNFYRAVGLLERRQIEAHGLLALFRRPLVQY